MVTDLGLNENKDVYIDSSNDLGLVSGIDQLTQSVGIDVFDETSQLIGNKLTGQQIGRIESQITAALNDDPQLADVVDVTIESYNITNGTIDISVLTVADESFQTTLGEP